MTKLTTGKRVVQKSIGRVETAAKSAASNAVKGVATTAKRAVKAAPGPSSNPMSNIIFADILLRSGGQFLRHAVERTLLSARFAPDKAKKIISGRSMTETLVGTAIARVATRSIPGALIVGGGMLAKSLYDRRKTAREAKVEGEAKIQKRIAGE